MDSNITITAKPVPEYDLYHFSAHLGRFKIISHWQGFVQLKRIQGDTREEMVVIAKMTTEPGGAIKTFDIIEASPSFIALVTPSPCS